MIKFKVGDKCKVINFINTFGEDKKHHTIGSIITIESVDEDYDDPLFLYRCSDGTYRGNDELELVTPKTTKFVYGCSQLPDFSKVKPGTTIPFESHTLTNTIITDIKDKAQHKRVQEKLFSMGNYWIGEKVNTFYSPDKDDIKQIALDDKGVMWIDCTIPGGGKHITANDFLQEVDEIQPFHFDRPLPDKITEPSEDDDKEPSPYETLTYIQNQVDKMSKGQPPQPKQRWWGKSLADQYMADIIQYYKTSPTTKGDTNNKPMNNIVSFFNDLTVSSEDKELRKAGLKNGELNWTHEAREIVFNLEAKERGYKNMNDLAAKTDNGDSGYEYSHLELNTLFTKFYTKLLDTAKKYNRKDEKKEKK